MTWDDYRLARQYLVETHIGTRIRQSKAEEDAIARSTSKALSRR